MFEIGWTELMLIGIVALIVIGPKDLPDMFRTMGRFTAKMRGMARDFSRAMEQAAKETGVNDIAADLKAATSAKSMGLDAVKDAASRFEKWDPMKPAAKPAVPVVAAPVAAVAEAAPTIHTPVASPLAGAQAAKSAVVAKAKISSTPVKAKPARKPRTVTAPAATPAKPPRAPRKPAKDA
jgi:sec-independent protein translocase protein TatB